MDGCPRFRTPAVHPAATIPKPEKMFQVNLRVPLKTETPLVPHPMVAPARTVDVLPNVAVKLPRPIGTVP